MMPLTAEQREWAQSQAQSAGLLFFPEFVTQEDVTRRPEESPPPELWQIKTEPNPCVRLFGRGSEGVTCRDCVHLIRHKPGRNTYLKCEFRSFTRGPGSDHKAGWQSCKKFEL